MQIANPIYDVVFKYLMEDSDSARTLISAIIGEEIESIECLPQENVAELEFHSLTVYRLDFSAKIKTVEGFKNILIEIQKAKYASDIMRFRRYLGDQYNKKDNSYEVVDKSGRKREVAIPIVTIYFLGYSLEHTTAPAIKVNRSYRDLTTNEELDVKEEFIESLTHDSYVIQIPYLNREHRTELEALLSIFDQRQIGDDHHILNIDESDFPESSRHLIRRLQKAFCEPVVRKTMDLEDELQGEFQDMERLIEKQGKKLEENQKELAEKDRMIAELMQRLQEN